MDNTNLKKSSIMLAVLPVFSAVSFCAEVRRDPNEFFTVGDHADIEIMVPKRGFVGARPSLAARRSFYVKIPSSRKNFLIQYVRIKVLEIRKLKNSTRVAFSLDEIDENGNFVMYRTLRSRPAFHEPLYYAYLFVKPAGCRMATSNLPIDKKGVDWEPKEIGIDRPDRTAMNGVVFPLTFTWPPDLSPHRSLKHNSWTHQDRGIVHFEPAKLPAPHYLMTTAALFEKAVGSTKPKPQDIRYYSDRDKTLGQTNTEDSIAVTVYLTETQIWKSSKDWLWVEMERTNSKGHVTMRCRRLK